MTLCLSVDEAHAEASGKSCYKKVMLHKTIIQLRITRINKLRSLSCLSRTVIQEQLANKVTKDDSRPGSGRSEDQIVDALISQHHDQVVQLQDRMQEAKDRQDHLLQEKLEAKKLKKER